MVCQQKEIRNSVVIHEGHACVHQKRADAQLSSSFVEALLPVILAMALLSIVVKRQYK
jgi:hypothetical protein